MPTVRNEYTSRRLVRHFVEVCILLALALCFVLPSGYSYGSALLCLASIPLLLWQQPRLQLNKQDWLFIATLLTYVVVHSMLIVVHGSSSRYFEEPSRFLLGVFVLLAVMGFRPAARAWWLGLAIGAISCGLVALWQEFTSDLNRAHGFMNAIQFGNLSLLFGGLSLAGLGWAQSRTAARKWCWLFVVAAALGLMASFFSGARGGWIALPLMLGLVYFQFRRWLTKRALLTATVTIFTLVAALYLIPQTGVQQRIAKISTGIESYIDGEFGDRSIDVRLEMWRAALTVAAEKPWLGWGETAYKEPLLAEITHPDIQRQVASLDHLHNDVLDTLVKRGSVGLMALLAVFMVPLCLFACSLYPLHTNHYSRSAFALSGLLLTVSVMTFGLTQAFLRHNSGVTLYAFILVVLWGYLRVVQQAADESLQGEQSDA